MSFILDALKKSELERQRQATPGLIGAGIPAARPRLPTWALVLGILLAVNVIVLGIFLFRHERGGSAAAVASTAPAGAAATAPTAPTADANADANAAHPAAAVPDHFSPMDSTPAYAPEIPVAQEAAPASVGATNRNAGAAHPSAAPQNLRAPPGQDALQRSRNVASDAARSDTDDVLPTIAELSLGDAQALPELHLDVHVFAATAADRFVYINNRKYREGASLAEGPLVERIRRDGVVLDYQGLRFLLPRQQ
jgi:general secretion pathway protein B